MGKKELIAARQHPMHTQGTGIWHLSCSKASVDPAGEHHNLHLRPRASHRSCWQGFNSLCLCSACYWFLLGSKGVRRACSSPKGAGGIVNDTLCQNWLSRNDHHPVGYRCCTGNLEDMGVPKMTGFQGDLRCRPLIEGCGHPFWRDTIAQHFVSWGICQVLVHYRTNLIWHYRLPEAWSHVEV